MTTEMKITLDRIHKTSIQTPDRGIRNSALKVGRFTLHLLEMLLAMVAGMMIPYSLGNLIPALSNYLEALESRTNLYDLMMAVFMTVPMVAWMIVRGHGFRHGAEMAIAMFAPVVAVIVLRLLGAGVYMPWLAHAGHLGMFLGMLAAMVYRRDHYTGKAGHSAHATHR